MEFMERWEAVSLVMATSTRSEEVLERVPSAIAMKAPMIPLGFRGPSPSQRIREEEAKDNISHYHEVLITRYL